jgi:hypothetical protein
VATTTGVATTLISGDYDALDAVDEFVDRGT